MDVVKKILATEPDILFILQFGSTVKNTETPLSDKDIAIYYTGKDSFKARLRILGNLPEIYDVHIYQELPLYVKADIVRHHKILYTKDETKTKEILINSIREYERFKKHLIRYHGGLYAK